MRLAAVTLLVVVGCAMGSWAGELPPGEQYTTLLGLQLEKVTLADVQQRLGEASLRESGDAGEYEASVCYAVPTSRTIVTFRSGELGGQEHTLLEVELRRDVGTPTLGCSTLSPILAPDAALHLSGLRLGMTQEAFARSLGGAEAKPGGGLWRTFERREPMTAAERASNPAYAEYPYWDIYITVAGEFRGGKLHRLVVSKTSTS